jgi:glycogen synthase
VFRKVEYQGLTLNSTTFQDHIEVYHVTREFGPASMGGLGMVVTALAVAQQMAGLQTVNIVLPYYSFLDNTQGIDIEFHLTLSINVRNEQDVQQSIRFNVYTFKYSETYDKGAVTPVTVWLIGPGDTHPFDLAFEVDDVRKIYFEPKVLSGEWKDLFFSKATAAFLHHQNTIRGAPHSGHAATVPIVVHLHGATNALVIHYLQQSTKNRGPVVKQPALVYTLHDYLAELLYSTTTESLQKFMDRNIYSHDDAQDMDMQWENISTYNHDHRIFTSSLGIDHAHVSTFVSKAMTKDIVEGRLDFYLKELVLDSILDQAEKNRFIGVTNGINLSRLNPWMADLRRHQLDFPAIESAPNGYTSHCALRGVQWQCSEQLYRGKQSGNPTIRSAKDAKRILEGAGLAQAIGPVYWSVPTQQGCRVLCDSQFCYQERGRQIGHHGSAQHLSD